MRLKAFFTGGTKAIGAAIAQTLAREVADVAIFSRYANDVAQSVAMLRAAGASADVSAVDAGDAGALRAWVEASGQALAGIDIVIANVNAMAIPTNEENWALCFQVDLRGVLRLAESSMRQQELSANASIVPISSMSCLEIDLASGPYGAFKASLVHFMQAVDHDTRPASAFAPRPNRQVTPTFRAAFGTRSSTATLRCSRPLWHSTRAAASARRKKWPTQRCFWPARRLA